jgi:N-hydroxyarylamine O-acetyltransferase
LPGTDEAYQRYLRLLKIDGLRTRLAGLETIVRQHLCRVPFENVSKLLLYEREGAGRLTTLPEFLDGIASHDLGGTCYSSNPFLAELLRALGYHVDLLGADMSTPNIHTCLLVRTGGQAYHVDVGYAAPFREPLSLRRLPREVVEGRNRYVLDRYAGGEGCEVTMFTGPEKLHAYVAHGPPRSLEFFTETVRQSYQPGTTFMTCLRISRFFEHYSVDLVNTRLSLHQAGETTVTDLRSMSELKAAVAGPMALPRCPVENAVKILEALTGKNFFAGATNP